MKRSLVVVSLVVVMVLGAMSAYAFGPGFGPRGKGGPCREGSEPGKGVSLTPEQKTKLQELRQKFMDETANIREALLAKKLELKSLWTNPKTEAKAIIEKDNELRDLKDQMRDKGLQFRLEARQFLTAEQIAASGPGCGMGLGFGRGQMGERGMGQGQRPCF